MACVCGSSLRVLLLAVVLTSAKVSTTEDAALPCGQLSNGETTDELALLELGTEACQAAPGSALPRGRSLMQTKSSPAIPVVSHTRPRAGDEEVLLERSAQAQPGVTGPGSASGSRAAEGAENVERGAEDSGEKPKAKKEAAGKGYGKGEGDAETEGGAEYESAEAEAAEPAEAAEAGEPLEVGEASSSASAETSAEASAGTSAEASAGAASEASASSSAEAGAATEAGGESGEDSEAGETRPGPGAVTRIVPFGKEDVAKELQTRAAGTQDTLVDAIEDAEVAEIKRAVFRSLTRLRAAEIKEFDTIARLETQAIDEYNDAHHFRGENPLAYIHNDEPEVGDDKYTAFHSS